MPRWPPRLLPGAAASSLPLPSRPPPCGAEYALGRLEGSTSGGGGQAVPLATRVVSLSPPATLLVLALGFWHRGTTSRVCWPGLAFPHAPGVGWSRRSARMLPFRCPVRDAVQLHAQWGGGQGGGELRGPLAVGLVSRGPPPEHAAVGRSHPGPLPMSSGGYRSPSLVGRAAFDAMGCVTAPASLASLLAAPVTGLLLEMASLTSLSAGPRPWRPRGCLAARTLTRSSLPDSLSIY